MTYKLFLDDERNPEDVFWVTLPDGPWVVVRSSEEFDACLRERGIPEFVSFDHDLGGRYTGKDCAEMLASFCMGAGVSLPDYQIHSMNPVGVDNIRAFMECASRFIEGSLAQR